MNPLIQKTKDFLDTRSLVERKLEEFEKEYPNTLINEEIKAFFTTALNEALIAGLEAAEGAEMEYNPTNSLPMNKPTCCSNCVYLHAHTASTCKCHTEKATTHEIEGWDGSLSMFDGFGNLSENDRKKAKKFITSLLTHQQERIIGELKTHWKTYNTEYNTGFNDSITETIEVVQKQ